MSGQRPPAVLGLDIGGTKLAAGVLVDGRLLEWRSIPAERESGPDAMIERLLGLAEAVVRDGPGWDAIEAVGIGCGGPLDAAAGIVHHALNLPGWLDIPIVERVGGALRRPVYLENDATAALLAELWYGAGAGTRDAVYLTISTGIGGAVALDGDIRRGAWGAAGEFGHLSVAWDGWPCICGRHGCLEAFASGTNIARRAREAIAAGGDGSALVALAGSFDAITAEHVARAAADGDPVASEVWDATTAVLGAGIVNILNALDPEVVVIGGGVTHAGPLLFEPLRAAARGALGPAAAASVVPAALGRTVGVVGAAAIALERMGVRRTDAQAREDREPIRA